MMKRGLVAQSTNPVKKMKGIVTMIMNVLETLFAATIIVEESLVQVQIVAFVR